MLAILVNIDVLLGAAFRRAFALRDLTAQPDCSGPGSRFPYTSHRFGS